MKSIQGVSIWKILGSFLVLTLCLSEARSGQTEETMEVVLRPTPKGILKMPPSPPSVQGLSSDSASSLDQETPVKAPSPKRVGFSADTVGGDRPNPYLIKRPAATAEQEELKPFSTELWDVIPFSQIIYQ